MAYTRAWDETFPADTQLANLLGQDIRNSKIDIRERISSFGAGLLASRPTPEATFAGVMYFATDNGTLYRWNGASWDVVGTIPPSGGTSGKFLRGDGIWTNVLLGDLTVNNLTTGNVIASGIVQVVNNGSFEDYAGNLGNPVIGSSDHSWTLIYFGVSDFHLFVDGGDQGRINLV